MLKNWWWPSILILALTAVSFVLLNSYFNLVQQAMNDRTRAATAEVAENLRNDIADHVRALQIAGEIEPDAFARSDDEYERVSAAIIARYPGFYSINWVDSRGIIRRVFPVGPNRAALGRNVLEQPSAHEYFDHSLDRGVPVIGSKLMMFQGFEAVSVSVPVYRGGRFRGWINAVLDIQSRLKHAMEARQDALSVKLVYRDDPKSAFTVGEPAKSVSRVEFGLLNRDIALEVGMNPDEAGARFEFMLFGAALLLLLLIAILLFSLKRSMQRLEALNRRLRLKNALISSLAHDMGTPLTVLAMSLDRLNQHPGEGESWARVQKCSQVLRQMLESVRLIHAMETRHLEIELGAVDLRASIRSAIDHVSVLADSKKIRILETLPAVLPPVFAENLTLSQNVIPNLLTNAIKFSPSGSDVEVRAEAEGGDIRLIIEDAGFGISTGRLAAILGDENRAGRGGSGEKSGGLGMIQVRTFMEVYGGRLEIESETEGPDRGTVVRLTFRRANGENAG